MTIAPRFGAVMLSLALGLSFATQLRIPSIPIGPGEVLLLLWILWASIGLWRDGYAVRVAERDQVILSFCALAVIGMVVGAFFGRLLVDVPVRDGMTHDTLAYGLDLALIVILVLMSPTRQDLARLFSYLVLVSVVPVSLLWVYGQFFQTFFGVYLWYGANGQRFSAWAINPNQTALLLVAAPFLALHLAELAAGAEMRVNGDVVLWTGVASAAFTVGWSVDSGALRLAWIVCVPLVVVMQIWKGRGKNWVVKCRELFPLVLALLGATALSLAVRSPIHGMPEIDQFKEGYHHGNELDVRIALFVNGLKAFASSYLLGYGPGSYSGLTAPFQGSEAHNSMVDWATSAGLVGLAALFWFVSLLLVRLWRIGAPYLVVSILALAAFAQFHHVLRHPMVWVLLIVLAMLSERIVSRSSACEE